MSDVADSTTAWHGIRDYTSPVVLIHYLLDHLGNNLVA